MNINKSNCSAERWLYLYLHFDLTRFFMITKWAIKLDIQRHDILSFWRWLIFCFTATHFLLVFGKIKLKNRQSLLYDAETIQYTKYIDQQDRGSRTPTHK